ncbi:TonB-dependent receptor domain-containing protein [Sphingopyxis sp. MG]|uniref:TonB-dependent receptor domain-containing protein n=1 Tax=Sphingopyxis sp. MG TaxID=1866325 RepID=UPI000CDF38CA|nr:TonB-dependent receptor [Sphingopyxis sp. MG]AVA12934.1 TonB-dependent receptor [Sphingopyxis sp. MG]
MAIRLNGSVSTIAIVLAVTSLGIAPAFAAQQEAEKKPVTEQETRAGEASEKESEKDKDIVVTGTAIRGVAPIGSNLVTLDRESIEETASTDMSELLNTVPAITTSGADAGENVFSYYSPQIHSLGGAASNTTLVLIDGMRIPGGGTRTAQTDPNILPRSAVQRVEVLADGASSIYGSDAVAGVVNYITRSSFSGAEIAGKVGFADNWHTYDVNGIVGTKWNTGGIYVAAQHTYRSPLRMRDRDFLSRGDFRSVGGRNTNTFHCSPATFSTPSSGSEVYLSPSATTTTAVITDNAPCNSNAIYADALGNHKRTNVLLRVDNTFGDRLTVTGTANYQRLRAVYRFGPAAVNNVTVFGPGAFSPASSRFGQINPFYTAPAGDPTATQQVVTWSAIRPGNDYGTQQAKNETLYLYGNAEYKLSDSWSVTLSNAFGHSRSYTNNYGLICTACVQEALNGTRSATGAISRATNIPLTTENALDVWQPNGGRTSEAVLASLYTNENSLMHLNRFNQAKLEAQGVVFALPAGDVRLAFGGEYYWAQQHVEDTDLTGEVSFTLSRNALSGYVEVAVPLVSEDMGVPLMKRLDLSLSGRYDHYNDVGGTTNPKIAANWEVVSGLRLRGNYATAFVAPPLTSIGIPELGYQRRATGVTRSQPFYVPLDIYPDARLLPGCASAVTVCQIGTSSNLGLTRDYGMGPDAKPQTGNSWSLGVDFVPPQSRGLRASLTYWSNKFIGGVNRLEIVQQLYSTAMRDRLTICPTGCTTAQINEFANVANGGTISTTLPPITYFMNNNDQGNVLNMTVQGIDADITYRHRTDFGRFTFGVSGTYYTRFDQNFGGEEFNTLNTSGYNSSFPQIQKRFRFQFGWALGDFSINGFLNHTGAYRNWSDETVEPLILDENNRPIGGGDRVEADTTVDMTAAYRLRFGGGTNARLYLNVRNLFDRDPVFYGGTLGRTYGINRYVSNPYGRIVTFGFSAEF